MARWIMVVMGAVALSGCESPKPGELVAFDDVCSEKYDADEAKQVFKRVTVEGYLTPPAMFTMCSHGSCSMDLVKAPGAKERLSISLTSGGGKNRMDTLPKKFSPSDLKVTTDDGQTIAAGGKIRVTGQRLGTKAGNSCSIYKVDLIEAAAP